MGDTIGRAAQGASAERHRLGTNEPLRLAHNARLEELLPQLLARIDWTEEQIAGERTRALRALIALAQKHSPWHQERLAGTDPNRVGETDLTSLPIMTKRDLMENFDEIVTDRRLDRETCAAHLGAGGYLFDEYHVIASGGSSGQRGIFVYGWDAWATCYASITRFQLRDWLADPALAGVERVTATVAAAHPSHISAAIRRTFTTPTQPLASFPVDQPIADIVAGLNAVAPTILMGYSSYLPRLAIEARAGRLRIAPRRVITISEPLLPELRTLLEETWQAPVANGYGISEGVVSGFCGDASHLPDDLCIIEAIDADGHAVPLGEVSARLLVTNLYNPVLPLIRYEVTDEVTIRSGRCSCGSSFRRIEDPQGRSDDLFVYSSGTVIHPHVFRSVIGQERSVIEYQVRQTAQGADIKITTTGAVDVPVPARRIEAALSAAGLDRPAVAIEAVPFIDRSPQGKLRRFIPLGVDG